MERRTFIQLLGLLAATSLLVACGSVAVTPRVIRSAGDATPGVAAGPARAVSPGTPTGTGPAGLKYEIVRDIPFESDGSAYALERDKLDLYRPLGIVNFPVLVFFHGGDLLFDDKNNEYAVAAATVLAPQGIAVVIPNYRLHPRAKYPDYLLDAAGAVAWVYKNIGDYMGDPKRIYVGGHSTGGYLAAMAAVDARYLERFQVPSTETAGVISLSGQMMGHPQVREELAIKEDGKADETAPAYYVRRDLPPFLLVCAESDDIGMCDANQKFSEALAATGHEPVVVHTIPGRNHFSVAAMADLGDPVVQRVLEFIRSKRPS